MPSSFRRPALYRRLLAFLLFPFLLAMDSKEDQNLTEEALQIENAGGIYEALDGKLIFSKRPVKTKPGRRMTNNKGKVKHILRHNGLSPEENIFYGRIGIRDGELQKIREKWDHSNFSNPLEPMVIGHPDPIKLAVSMFSEIEKLNGFTSVSSMEVGSRSELGNITVGGQQYNVSVTKHDGELEKFYISSDSLENVTGKARDGSDTHGYGLFLTEGKYVNTFFPSNNN